MKFEGTIIITDPCYISNDADWGREFNWEDYKINLPQFSDYIWDSSGYGDGSCKVYQMKSITNQMDLEKIAYTLSDNEVSEELKNGIRMRSTQIGQFCMDSGSFCVCYLNEALKYNPKILTDYGNWCYTIIEDFIGDIEIFKSDSNFHVIGTGNKSFYTI
jgi:hypothetical protein